MILGAGETGFLQTPGAIDVGVEVHSMSKGYDMIGWRIGWVHGPSEIIEPEQTGLLVSPGDGVALAATVIDDGRAIAFLKTLHKHFAGR